MTTPQPNVDLFRSGSVTERHEVWERSRFEWRIGDGGDPAELVRAFLGGHDLGLPDPGSFGPGSFGPGEPGRLGLAASSRAHLSREVCGAALFVSAAAGAAMLGVSAGALSPSPAIPDLVAVVYGHAETPATQPGVGEGKWRPGAWASSWSPRDHAAAVETVREAIARGDVYQVNVVGHAAAAYSGDPMPALRRVAALPGATYAGILTGDGWAIASASPEALVRVEGGLVETRPIKGTRPATASGRRELLASAKERAEHIMIVDLERNDLAHVARTGTVDVPDLFVVRRWCDLWQAESRVTARVADGVDLADLLRAVCPGGSVTGAPKLAALVQIAALEPVGRGPSMGALGWLDANRLDLGLTIRTVAVDGERMHLWAGGGITWDSDPLAEVAEANEKAAPLRAALGAAR